jgi:threonine 3-dehydrogenase
VFPVDRESRLGNGQISQFGGLDLKRTHSIYSWGLRQMPSIMKALRKMKSGTGLNLERMLVPSTGPTEVLIRVKAASICGTDLHIYAWDRWSASRIKPPLTLGHEFCGVVERVGKKVTGVQAGDFVSAEMHVCCNDCPQCRVGESHICQKLSVIGIDSDGAFAEFVQIPASNVWKLDRNIPEHYGAIMDPLGNAVHAVLAGPVVGSTILITGCGPIGLMSVAVARACGSSTILVTETSSSRRRKALEMGADIAIDPAEVDTVARVKSETKGIGVDVLLEMSGNATAIQQGFRSLRAGGRASLLGIPTEMVPFDLVNDVIFKGITVKGIYGRRMYKTWVQMAGLLNGARLKLDPLFGEQRSLENFEDAFRLLRDGFAGKIMLTMDGTKL